MSRGVEALIAALMPTWPVLGAEERQDLQSDIAAFVRTEIGLAPFHVRLGVRVLTVAFFVSAALWGMGRGFSSRPPDWQRKFLDFWGGISAQTQAMVRVYRSLSVLAYYESAPVLRALEVEARADQVERFRALREKAVGADAA